MHICQQIVDIQTRLTHLYDVCMNSKVDVITFNFNSFPFNKDISYNLADTYCNVLQWAVSRRMELRFRMQNVFLFTLIILLQAHGSESPDVGTYDIQFLLQAQRGKYPALMSMNELLRNWCLIYLLSPHEQFQKDI